MRLDRRHILLLLVGNFMLAAASSCFLLPAHVIGGGVNGLAVILEKAFQIEPTQCINGMIFTCFILGVFFLGRDFALKTIASTLLYPLFLQILSLLPCLRYFHQFALLSQYLIPLSSHREYLQVTVAEQGSI